MALTFFGRFSGRAAIALGAVLAGAMAPRVAQAQWLTTAAASEIEHGYYTTAPGGGAPIFDPVDGQMFQPGGFYPTTAANPIAQADTGVVGLPSFLVTAPGALDPGFGGAGTSLSLVNHFGRIGIAVNQYYVYDRSPLGFASTNIYGGAADFRNVTGGALNFNGGHFMGFRGRVGAGGYVAVGVRSVFEVFNGVGGLISSFTPTPIVWASNGDGNFVNDVGLADFGVGWDLGAAGVGFRASSLVNVLVPAGATLRIRGTVTVIADPDSDVDLDVMPIGDPSLPLPDVGTGVSTNAASVFAPEPGSFALAGLCLPLLALLKRRRMR